MAFLLRCKFRPPLYFSQHVPVRDLSSNVKLDDLRENAYNNYIQRKIRIKVIRTYEGKPSEEDYEKEKYYKNMYLTLMSINHIDEYKTKLST